MYKRILYKIINIFHFYYTANIIDKNIIDKNIIDKNIIDKNIIIQIL